MPSHISLPVAIAMVVFVAVAVLIGSAMAGAGGWRDLAERYPMPAALPASDERYRFTSLRTAGGAIGIAIYESCVMVGISSRGISLVLWAPLRLFHPPVLLPWEAVEKWRHLEVYGNHSTLVTVRGGGSVTVFGPAAVAIARWASERGIPTGAA